MTEKLFYKDPYICEAECKVVDIINNDTKYEIVLDKTPFYPEGGGQPNDIGYINNIKVEYVYEKEGTIYHVMPQKPEGDIVKCSVDFERRFDNTQQHSGEHLLSAAFFKLYKGVNKGFHMGDEYVTIDIDMKDITEDMLKRAEMEANSYVFRNAPVKTYFLSKEEALKLPLRKAIKANGTIRIVQMGDDIDYAACCGTSVKRTGEVGTIKILKSEKYKGMTRIYFKCGKRALNNYIKEHDIISELARSFSIDEDKVEDKVKSQTKEIVDLNKEISELNSKLAFVEAEKLVKESKSKYIISEYNDNDIKYVQDIYECLKDKEFILILSSLKDKKIIYGHNGSFDIDCGKIFKENIREFNGKGGGNKKRAQGAFESQEDLKRFTKFLSNI